MSTSNIRICKRCVMDNSSDHTITFDENGYCDYCSTALAKKDKVYFPGKEGEEKLNKIVEEIKEQGKGKKYDCIMGISGGLDSSYLAYIGYKKGLRVLAVHIDDGYDTEISKENIKKLIERTGFDYKTVTPDATQFNSLILAFMRGGVPNLAMPQDDVLFAFLYDQMKKYDIKYFLSGVNFALECILQRGNTHAYTDVVNIKDINRKFGTNKIDRLKFLSTKDRIINKYLLGLRTVMLLDYVDYNRNRAFKELSEFCGFEYYGRKHLENIFTGFVQLYWFPKKFGVDKRKSHLSSMIVSGQMTREEALRELEEPLYEEEQMNEWINYIANKVGISREELEKICNLPAHQHDEYKTEKDTLEYQLIRIGQIIKNKIDI